MNESINQSINQSNEKTDRLQGSGLSLDQEVVERGTRTLETAFRAF